MATSGRPFQPLYGQTAMESIFRLYLPDEDRALLDLVARRTGRSRSAIVREALEAHLPALLLQRSGPDEGAA